MMIMTTTALTLPAIAPIASDERPPPPPTLLAREVVALEGLELNEAVEAVETWGVEIAAVDDVVAFDTAEVSGTAVSELNGAPARQSKTHF